MGAGRKPPTLDDGDFESASAAWRDITRVPPAWVEAFENAKEDCSRLVGSGAWLKGHSDLLSIVGRQHQEAVHSAAIGWLLDPSGSHGLGPAFLIRFLKVTGAEDLAAKIECDRVLAAEALITSEVHLEHDGTVGRLDILLELLGEVVVIENKVIASEHGGQLRRYRQLARVHPSIARAKRTRLVLLALAPRRDLLNEARRQGFTAVTYRQAVELPLLEALDSAGNGPGRIAAEDYLRTIRRLTR